MQGMIAELKSAYNYNISLTSLSLDKANIFVYCSKHVCHSMQLSMDTSLLLDKRITTNQLLVVIIKCQLSSLFLEVG